MVNPRRAQRVHADGLKCQLGDILDLSETGLRIRSLGRPKLQVGAQLKLTIASSMQRLSVKGQVVWVKRSLFSGSLGIRFVDAPPALARALVELAMHGFVDPSVTSSSPLDDLNAQHGSHDSASATPKTHSTQSKPVVAQVELEDYYAALGLLPSATTEEINAAYRALARQLHPDVNPSADAAQRFTYVSSAYAVLKDPAKRLRYDQQRRSAEAKAA